ncbi:MAG: hypothetical protein MI867_06240 [Pseudomonadales bacterium]|nr:hypothetical protein [Pseudomonadales bacterium]
MLLTKLPRALWLLILITACVSSLLLSSVARANSFDDAVNHYLKGFESCKEASGLLRSNQVAKAKAKMREYDRHFDEAQKMDASIVKTKNRGMEGNILFCQRVSQNLEVEEGTPFMDKAIEHCDLAQKALKADDPTSAQANLDQFKELSTKALEVAPRMNDIFSIASQVRRCERLQKKVSRKSQKLESENLTIETVKEESQSYVTACVETEKQLNSRAVDDALIKAAGQGIASAKSHKKNTRDETQAFKIFKERPDHPAKPVVEGNLKKGDQCIAKLERLLGSKKSALKKIKASFASYEIQIVAAQKQCNVAEKKAKAQASDAVYVAARKSFQQAQISDKKVRDALKKDKNYRTYSSWPSVKTLDTKLIAVSNCIARTNKLIGAMFAKLQADKQAREKAEAEAKEKARLAQEKARLAKIAKAKEEAKRRAEAEAKAKAEATRLAKIAAEKAAAAAKAAADAKAKAAAKAAQEAAKKAAEAAALAKKKAEEEAAKQAAEEAAAKKAEEEKVAAAKKAAEEKAAAAATGVAGVNDVKGSITFDGLIADHAVVYIEDGSTPPSSLEIELDKSGFEKPVYIAGGKTSLSIKNKDNSLHRIKATDDLNGYSETLIRVYPRQKKKAKVGWPVNTVVSIRSERGALTESYIAHVNSGTYSQVEFNVGATTFDFELKGSGKGSKIYVLMPGHDTLMVDFTEGSQQTKPITQGGAPVGSVTVNAN